MRKEGRDVGFLVSSRGREGSLCESLGEFELELGVELGVEVNVFGVSSLGE